MKLKLIAIILSTAVLAKAELPTELLTSLTEANTLGQANMDSGNSLASSLLQKSTWTIMKRICVSDFSVEAFNNPTQSFDMTYYYNVINYNGTSEVFTTTNADRANTHCVSQATGDLSAVPVKLNYGGMEISEVITLKTLTRKKINCSDAYKGPGLAKVFNVVKVDENSAYFFLLPGQLTGSTSSCTNPKDFNVEFAVRVPEVQ